MKRIKLLWKNVGNCVVIPWAQAIYALVFALKFYENELVYSGQLQHFWLFFYKTQKVNGFKKNSSITSYMHISIRSRLVNYITKVRCVLKSVVCNN